MNTANASDENREPSMRDGEVRCLVVGLAAP
jgi:hypothetical protein